VKSFKHINVTSIHEACKLLRKYRGKARLIAGGTDLLGILKDRVLPEYPEALINIKTIPNLNYIKEDKKGLRIGALTILSDIVKSPMIQKRYSVLAEASREVATTQIRNMATLGGNLCQEVRCWYYRYPHQVGGRILCLRKGKGPCLASSGDNRYHAIFGGKRCFAVCPSDTAVALTALRGKVVITDGKGRRTIPIEEFFTALGNVLGSGEIVTEIQVPRPDEKAKQTFLKFTLRRPIDFAIVSVASVISLQDGVCKEARIALGGVAPTPLRAVNAEHFIKGKTITPEIASHAAEEALKEARPLSLNAYKIELTKALIQKALMA
jgi:xanthine dehydrogenase YagS FAD-binding subunit